MCPSGPEASILLPFGHAVARRGCTPIPRRAIYCGAQRLVADRETYYSQG